MKSVGGSLLYFVSVSVCIPLHSLFFSSYSHFIICTVHLIGVNGEGTGHKSKWIESMTNCKVRISGKHHPMTIDITSSLPGNIAQGISMIEESLMEFVSDDNSEKKMLHELLSTAEGSYKVRRNNGCRLCEMVSFFLPEIMSYSDCSRRLNN